jgi:hypothetical protein
MNRLALVNLARRHFAALALATAALSACNRAEVEQMEANRDRLQHELTGKENVASGLARFKTLADEAHLQAAADSANALDPTQMLARLSTAAPEVRFGLEKSGADTIKVTLNHEAEPSWAVHSLQALSEAVPTLALEEVELRPTSWSAKGNLTAPHHCCALTPPALPAEDSAGLLCLGKCSDLRKEIAELRTRIATQDKELDSIHFVDLAEVDAAMARPDAIRAEMHLITGVLGGEEPPLSSGRVVFHGDSADVIGAFSRKATLQTLLGRTRGSFEVERVETTVGFSGAFHRKPASLPKAPFRDAALTWLGR